MAVDKKGLGRAQREFRDSFKKRVKQHNLMQFLSSLLVFVIGVALIGLFSIGIYQVQGNGMAPEIVSGSYVFANKLAYKLNRPERGDVILTTDGEICRIIGMPGEKVTFNGGLVYANDAALNEAAYLGMNKKDISVAYSDEEYVVPEGEYMILCDDRDCFNDSRSSGTFITTAVIKGKIFFAF